MKNGLRYLSLMLASSVGVILAFATYANVIFASVDLEQPSTRRNHQVGMLNIFMYEFEDILNDTWIEIKITLNQDWLSNNPQYNTQLSKDRYAKTFVSYMSRVVNWIDMVEVYQSLEGWIGVVARSKYKQQSMLTSDNVVSSKLGLFNVYRTYEYDNPIGQIWQGVQQGNQQVQNIYKLNVLQQLAKIWQDGDSRIINGNKVEIATLYDEMNITVAELTQSNVRYYISVNRYLDTKGHNVALISKRNFVYFDDILSNTSKIQLHLVSPNSVGYNVVLIVVGLVTVLIIYIFTRSTKFDHVTNKN